MKKQGKLLTIFIYQYEQAVKLLVNNIFHLYPKRRKRLLYGIQNHVATRILTLLIKHTTILKTTLQEIDHGAYIYLYQLGKTTALVAPHLIEIDETQIKITTQGRKVANHLKMLFT